MALVVIEAVSGRNIIFSSKLHPQNITAQKQHASGLMMERLKLTRWRI